MKHTPGPWTLGKGLYTVREDRQPIGGFGRAGFIARTHLAGEWRNRSEEEQHANAVLIAAAPDMLDVLRYLEPRAREAKKLSQADMLMIMDVIVKATKTQE